MTPAFAVANVARQRKKVASKVFIVYSGGAFDSGKCAGTRRRHWFSMHVDGQPSAVVRRFRPSPGVRPGIRHPDTPDRSGTGRVSGVGTATFVCNAHGAVIAVETCISSGGDLP